MKSKFFFLFLIVFFLLVSNCVGAFDTQQVCSGSLLELPAIIRVLEIWEDMVPFMPIFVKCQDLNGSTTFVITLEQAYFQSLGYTELKDKNKEMVGGYRGHFLKKGDLIQVLEYSEEVKYINVHVLNLDSKPYYHEYSAEKIPIRFVTKLRVIKSLKDKLLKPKN